MPSEGANILDHEERHVSLTQFQRQFSQYLKTLGEEPLVLTAHGAPVAAVLDFEAFRALMELEEQAEDLYWTVVALRRELEWRQTGKPLLDRDAVEHARHGAD
ncbi:MAG: type II toxin-antitoxin system Phd/YefM family antitoxin [Firmicutes bacterium]|nr:type II toxin-antitoxin system Phd/YefM family antitoxin [Bacillota bacterium]